MSCYSNTCSCSRCREGISYEDSEGTIEVKRATQDEILKSYQFKPESSKVERLKRLMKEFPNRSVEDLLKLMEIHI